TNVDRLENGLPTRLRLDRHGAVIGRSPTADWSLPDPQHYISSVHCEVDYRDSAYVLVDKSTNGTFINGDQQRLAGPHTLCAGDVVVIGHYSIRADLEGAGGAQAAQAPAQQQTPEWGGWQPQPAAASVDEANWDRAPAAPAISGQGAMSGNWAPPPVGGAPGAAPSFNTPSFNTPPAYAAPADTPPVQSAWATPAPAATPASGWSSPVNEQSSAPSAVDVWGQLAASNVVDWARGGFGERQADAGDPLGLGSGGARLRPDPLGLGGPTPATPPPHAAPQPASPSWAPSPASGPAAAAPAAQPAAAWGPGGGTPPPQPQPEPAWASRPAAAPAPSQGHPSIQAVDAELAAFLVGAGLQPTDLKVAGAQAMTSAGSALRRMISGLVVMLEARARAKAQLGAQGTSLEFDGNNPLKFARAPEKAIAQLLNPPERGFMSADRAIDDAFRDLQAHQMATLTAMQGALASTLARFSPQAIRERAESQGFLSKLLPGGREATLWQAYEREFEGVARGSDEAFMDVFAKEFRQAYERVSAEMKRKP
ncbi:MAG TPA: type VI secretion system-associated FHA domain protein TagH, partial [Caulobacteraceae bacterium]|nr:type VI secretion system-associated FHA domain protein TagH [Caulobacteraceae bacterium]